MKGFPVLHFTQQSEQVQGDALPQPPEDHHGPSERGSMSEQRQGQPDDFPSINLHSNDRRPKPNGYRSRGVQDL
jgi:hypothetical protein